MKNTTELLERLDNVTNIVERINQTVLGMELDTAQLKELIKYAREEANQVRKVCFLNEK